VISLVAEQQARSSFNFWRQGITAGVGRPLTPTIRVAANYELERTRTFDEQFTVEDELLIDRAFPQVRLSSFSGSVIRDTRDDQLNPLRGRYVSANAQIAARNIGSEVGFFKTFLTGQLFHPLSARRRIVFAASARIGLATPFPRELALTDSEGNPILDAGGNPVVDVIEELPASERYFAGGDSTVRGFALDQLGTPETIDQNGFPIGGNAVTILNAELRVPFASWFGVVGFVDAGNVFARTTDLDFGEIRGTVGIGARFALPFGPVRVDLGFKTDRRDITPGNRESLTALHISLGQAF
jgi:outer membrane protein insertion porin family